MKNNNGVGIFGIFLLLFISVIWGASYYLIKKSLIHFTPVQVAGVRLLITSMVFLPFGLKYLNQINRQNIVPYLIVGFCGSAFPAYLFAEAQTKINSSLTGALSSLTPIFTLLVGIAFFNAQNSIYKLIGISIGFIGALTILLVSNDHSTIKNPFFGVYVALAALGYAISTNTISYRLKGISSLQISSIAFTLTLIPALLLTWSSGVFHKGIMGDLSIQSFYPVITLALLSSVITSILYFWLIKLTSAVFAATTSFLTPVVAFVLGVWDGEPLHLIHIIGTILLVLGVFLTRK